MTEYTITALTYSDHCRPYGDGYAPQVVLTHDYGWSAHELNTDTLPVDGSEISDLFDRFRESCRGSIWSGAEMLVRYFRIFYGIEVHHTPTSGYSQGDWGHSFVFATPEWLEMTGAPGVRESDHNDFCAWLWGDVYEVLTAAVTHTETCNLGHDHIITDVESELEYIIYGMDEAMKFANEHNIEIEGF